MIHHYIVLWFNVCNKELLALRNNFSVTKKFLIAKFDCTTYQNQDLKHNFKILHQFNSNIRAHLMSLGENIEAFDSLKKLERIFIKKKH